MPASVRIGTSGWEYRDWAGDFYPASLPRDRWLEHYASQFDTVELNNSFYRLPDAAQFERWSRRVPDGFAFAVKASRYLTHTRRLKEPSEAVERLWARCRRLGDHLGPVLYQLPPRWKPNLERLAAFLAALPQLPQAVEFRDARWYGAETLALLRDAKVALCLHDMPGSKATTAPVGPFVYVRFHGSGRLYGGRYPTTELAAWAERMAGWSADGLPVWVYFNNDIGGQALRDASRLRDLVASACSNSGGTSLA